MDFVFDDGGRVSQIERWWDGSMTAARSSITRYTYE